MKMDVLAVLKKLDPDSNDHWTNAGLPSISAVSEIAGAPVSRAQVAEAWPSFDRSVARAGDGDAPESETKKREEEEKGGEVDQITVASPAAPEGSNDHGLGPDAHIGPNPECMEEASVSSPVDEGDAIVSIEAALLLAQSPRYASNAELQAFVRQWQVQYRNIVAWQDRIDKRNADRAAR